MNTVDCGWDEWVCGWCGAGPGLPVVVDEFPPREYNYGAPNYYAPFILAAQNVRWTRAVSVTLIYV